MTINRPTNVKDRKKQTVVLTKNKELSSKTIFLVQLKFHVFARAIADHEFIM